jgi:hypothetical protein
LPGFYVFKKVDKEQVRKYINDLTDKERLGLYKWEIAMRGVTSVIPTTSRNLQAVKIAFQLKRSSRVFLPTSFFFLLEDRRSKRF